MCRSVRSTVSMRAPECSTSTPTSAWIVVRANRPAASRRSTGKAIYPTINTSIWGQRRLFPPSPAGPSGSAGFAGWCRSGGPDRSRHASGRGYPGGVPLVAGDEHTTPNAIRRPRPAVLSGEIVDPPCATLVTCCNRLRWCARTVAAARGHGIRPQLARRLHFLRSMWRFGH